VFLQLWKEPGRNPTGTVALYIRLLHDIAEVRDTPYPNVTLHFHDANIRNVCLVPTPEGSPPLHLQVRFPKNYPLCPPTVTSQSAVNHPNIFGDHICADMLSKEKAWTSAYTLRGIAIQLLSFFSSDQMEQEGNVAMNMEN
jgi:ubiquitin-protein ligase